MTRADIGIEPAAVDELCVAGALRGFMAREEGLDWDERYSGWRDRFAAFFAEKQRRGDAQVFFARRAGDVIGMAAFSILDEYRAAALGQPRGWVNSVFVLPELRRQGIARSLMRAGIVWLRARGCVAVRLRTSDAGRPLYQALGFVPTSEMELPL